ncbi:MAG: hypothetical protein ACREHG_00610, partial [Candidatus Saccharimonadales bacterium]
MAYNGYIYVIGGATSGSTAVATVCYATLNGATGAVGTWTAVTANLPSARYLASAVVYNGYVYVVGGSSGGSDQTTVYYAQLQSNGNITSWSTTTGLGSVYVSGLEQETAVENNGYMYILGGDSAGTVESAVYYAPINSNGTLGSWTSTNSWISVAGSTALDGAASVVNNGYIYELGGSSTTSCSGSNTDMVYYAPLNSNGTVGTWAATTAIMGNGRYGSSAVAWGGYAYNLSGTFNGGSCGTAAVTNMDGQLQSDGDITSFGSVSGPYGAWQGAAAVYNGYAYYLGGTPSGPSGTGLTTVEYTPVSGNNGIAASGGAQSVDLTLHSNNTLLRPNTDSTTAFQIQNASANP